MEIDVELALISATPNKTTTIQDDLPSGFFVEDRFATGWGLVIRSSQKPLADLSDSIDAFLKPLRSMAGVIHDNGGVLRIGVFYSTATCTMHISSCKQLASFGLPIEITTYPTSDE